MDNNNCRISLSSFSLKVLIVYLILSLNLTNTLINANVVPIGVVEGSRTTISINGVNLEASTTKPTISESNLSDNQGSSNQVAESANFVPKVEENQNENVAGYENNGKTTKDDWYYDPDEEETNDEWVEGDDKNVVSYEKAGTVISVPDAENDNNDGDDDQEDDPEEDNYDFWTKFQDKNHNNENQDEEETNEGIRHDGDVDEKLLEDVVDEDLVKKNKPPTAPSNMVLFYTWMILAIIIMVIGVSTYQTRCKGAHSNNLRHQTREDRKRLVDHEYT